MAKISYIYILIPSDNCFQANFQEFYMFSSQNVGIITIFEHEEQKCGKISHETREMLFYHASFLSFWKS